MINARERAGFKTGLQFYVGRSASDHQFVRDPAYIHLEIEALHRRAREMPSQTAGHSSAANDLCYEAKIGKQTCRPLANSTRKPLPLLKVSER